MSVTPELLTLLKGIDGSLNSISTTMLVWLFLKIVSKMMT